MMFRIALRDLRAYPTKAERPCRIDLASNEIYKPSPAAVAAIEEFGKSRINRYPDPSNRKLREALAKFHGLDPANFGIFNGMEEGLRCAVAACADHDRGVLSYWPSFEIYRVAAQIMGADFKTVMLENGFSYLRRTERQIVNEITDDVGLIIVCNPNNPTGTIVPRISIERILNAAKKAGVKIGRPDGIAVLVDEAYYEFFGKSVIDLLPKYPNLIVGRTFSKAYGLAGMRVGYLATGKPENAGHLQKIRPIFSVCEIAEVAAIAALEDQDWVKSIVDGIIKERQRLTVGLSKAGIQVYPSATNFLLVDVSPMGMDREQFVNALLETAEIKVRGIPLEGFNGQFVRITIGTQEENTELLTAIEGITKLHQEIVDLGANPSS